MDPDTIPFVRRDYKRPARDDASCVSVGRRGMSAFLAREAITRCPVLLVGVPACGAFTRRITRINKFHRNSDQFAFVGDLRPKIRKRPRMQTALLAFSSPYPRTNMLEVFKRDSSLCAFSLGANLFRNQMVHLPNKSGLPSTKSAKNAPGRARALSLKSSTLSMASVPNRTNLTRVSVCSTVGILSNIDKPKINSDPTYRLLLIFLWNINDNIEVPFVLSVNQIRFAFRKPQEFTLALTADKTEFLDSSTDGPNAHGRFRQLEIQNSAIIRDASMLPEAALCFAVAFICICDFRVKSNDDLRRQGIFQPDLSIKKFVHWELTKFFRLPRQIRKSISRAIHSLHGLTQRLRLLGRREQLDLHCQFHSR